MKPIIIRDDLRAICPLIAVAAIEYTAVYLNRSEMIWTALSEKAEGLQSRLSLEELVESPPIRDCRKVYRALGKDPTRYRVSSEALIRRIIKGKGIYQVNNIVDFNNLLSLRTFFSAGSFDRIKIQGDIHFGIGQKEDYYCGIGRDQLNIEGLPVLIDELGPFGSPTSDSERTRIRPETMEMLTVILSFSGPEVLEPIIAEATKILSEIIEARNIEAKIYV